MSNETKPDKDRTIPDIIVHPQNRKRYLKGKFLGKGGFARCFELTDMDTNEIYAGKIVSKSLLTKKHQKDKMAQEIAIHRSLAHKHIVKFISYFEDDDNVYILLELCRRRSLMELHKRRRAITEPETRYYVYQILLACKYLHENRVIHRDLKLGNLFLNDDMEVKIGDFGLATVLDYDGERKKTLCGTPNYIAPEMLSKKGHSYEVDTWAIGCIMFTLLVGKPPFETQTLKETYMRIKRNEYHVPSKTSSAAKHLIQKLLQQEPNNRPTVNDIFSFEFLQQGYMPNVLPVSCLTLPPNFPKDSPTNSGGRRLPLGDNTNNKEFASPQIQARKDQLAMPVRSLKSVPENQILPTTTAESSKQIDSNNQTEKPSSGSPDFHLHRLFRQLTQLVHSKPNERAKPLEDEAEDPAAMPVFWISKWVDYSDKFGLGYQLCDNSVGVLFNDYSKILLNGNGGALQYIDRDGVEEFHTMTTFPQTLSKKITLLNYFRTYMNEHLLKAGENVAPKEGDELARLPYLRQWFRTRSAIVLHLSNGTLQINFFKDHVKLILCPLMGAITFINENREFKTFRFSLLEQYGCCLDLSGRIEYARNMVERLMLKTSSSSGRPLATTNPFSVGSEERK